MDTDTKIKNTEDHTTDKNHPEKYIRTFESDMKTIQEGGTPKIAPIKEVPPTPPTPPTPPLPPTEIQKTKEPYPVPIVTPPKSTPTPTPPPTVQTQQTIQEPIQPHPKPATHLETYASDFSEKIKKTNASTATVIAAEQDSLHGEPKKDEPKERSNNLIYIISGILLLIAGLVSAYFAYEHYSVLSRPVVIATNVSTPIFVEEKEEVSGEGSVLLQAIEASMNRPITTGSVRLIYNSSTTTTESIFSMLRMPAPDIFLRSIQANGSMAGIIFIKDDSLGGNINNMQSPFFILSVSSYSNTFAGMLSWEKTILKDFSTIFPEYPLLTISTSTDFATSTDSSQSSSTQLTLKQDTEMKPGFYDEVVSNHDARVYRDGTGRSILIYGYWNKNTLVIARDPIAFAEILQRLATSRVP